MLLRTMPWALLAVVAIAWAYSTHGRTVQTTTTTAAKSTVPTPDYTLSARADKIHVKVPTPPAISTPGPQPTVSLRRHVTYVPSGGSSDCDKDSLASKSDEGDYLKTTDGREFRVDDADTSTSSVWVVPDDVVICDEGSYYKIINSDDNGESVEAHLIQ